METAACEFCGSSNFIEQDGLLFCGVCQSQSEFVRELCEEEIFQNKLKVQKSTSRKKIKALTQETINYYSKWSTNEAFNIILKRLVEILIKLGADPSLKKVVFQLWVLYLRKTKFAFCKPIYQTKEWKPRVPVLPRERDKQVLLENKHLIEARKFRKSFLQTLASKKVKRKNKLQGNKKKTATKKSKHLNKKKLKAAVILSEKDEQDLDKNVAEVEEMEMNKDDLEDEPSTKSASKKDKVDDGASKKSEPEKVKPKRNRYYCTSWNSVSVKAVGIIGRMSMERVLEILFLGLLLVHKRVLLCDLLGWIESSELPFRECSHLLPENIKFQTSDNATFRINNMPSHQNLRKNTCKLAKFLNIHSLPDKCLPEIVKRFVVALSLPDEMNQLVSTLISLDPPQMQCNNADKKRTYPIPNYEGRALAYIIVVLKLLCGLDGKTELEQSIYGKKLASLIPDGNFFVWEEWVLATEKTTELNRRKNLFQNLDCLEGFTDVDQVVNYYLNTAKFHKGRFTDTRQFAHAYWREDVRNPVRKPILSLFTELDELTKTDEACTLATQEFISWNSLGDNVALWNVNENFHSATFKHIIEPTWVQDLLEPQDVVLNVSKTSGWEKSQSESQNKSELLTVYQPFFEYFCNHYWRSKRGCFNFAALNQLPRSLVWLVDVCANCGRMPPESLYEEVMLIERVLITSSENNVEPKWRRTQILNMNKARSW